MATTNGARAAIVLVGGRGSRLGGVDKPLVPVRGRPLCAPLLEMLGRLFDEVVLVAGDPRPYAGLGLRVVADRNPGAGPLAGLEAGLAAIDAPRALVVAGDMPAVSAELVGFLLEVDPTAPAVVPVVDGRRQPLLAVYRADLAGRATACLAAGRHRMDDLLDGLDWTAVDGSRLAGLPGALASFEGVNTPANLAAWRGGSGLLAVAAPGNDSGKTTLVCRILETHPGVFAAIKAITIDGSGFCPTDGVACACRQLDGDLEVVVDPGRLDVEGTDTGRMAAAGARRVAWAIARPGRHEGLWRAVETTLGHPVGPALLEGSRIRSAARPDGLLFVFDPAVSRRRWKGSTADDVAAADHVLVNRHRDGRQVEDNLAWLAERRPDARPIDLTRPLAEAAPPGLLAWIESFTHAGRK